MATLDLDTPEVMEKSLTVEEIRADDEALHEKLGQWLDEAQGDVFSGERKVVHLVIEITK
jgi:hypothetical protein